MNSWAMGKMKMSRTLKLQIKELKQIRSLPYTLSINRRLLNRLSGSRTNPKTKLVKLNAQI